MARSEETLAAETPLLDREIPDAEVLVRDAGWNQTASDWRIFLDLGTVYAIRTKSSQVIATAATLPYGGRFGWISMVLVANGYQRLGLATRLLRRCIHDLTTAGLVPVLDATPAGREVYRTLGFQDSGGFQRYMHQKSPSAAAKTRISSGVTLKPITDAIWPTLCAYDASIFGADRSKLLTRMRGRAPSIERLAERNGRIAGMLLGRDGRVATQIGPLVANDDEVATALLAQAIDDTPGQTFIDVMDGKLAIIAELSSQGFVSQRQLRRMLLGQSAAFDDGARTYAVAGPEFG